MSIVDILKEGVTTAVGAIGTAARDIRAAITGKEIETEAGRMKVLELAQQIETAALEADKQAMLAQTEINKIEAASPDLFRAGWRPAVGWLCAAALAYQFLIRPLLPWVVGLFHVQTAALPVLDMGSVLALLAGMLGLGGFRTFEKVKGIQ